MGAQLRHGDCPITRCQEASSCSSLEHTANFLSSSLSALELQRDEEEAAALGAVQRPSAAATADQDPALSLSHPFYDVARHGILQVGGESRWVVPGA